MPEATDMAQLIQRLKELLTLRMSQMHSYHDHKETMAHAALLVQLGLVAGILSMDSWPPKWVPSLCVSSIALATTTLLIIALLIHIYIRWQLQRRRMAALYVQTILRVLRNWAYAPPTDTDLSPWSGPSERPSSIHSWLDMIVPWNPSRVFPDEGIIGYPKAFVDQLLSARTGAIHAEILVSYGSLLLIVILVIRSQL